VSLSGGPTHESLNKAYLACVVSKEVDVTKLEANIDARKFRTFTGVRGEWRLLEF
jgi:hypothetical protein